MHVFSRWRFHCVQRAYRLSVLDRVPQASQIVKRVHFHRLCSLGNANHESLAFIFLHSRVHVSEMNEMIFGNQRIFPLIFVVHGDSPLGARHIPPVVCELVHRLSVNKACSNQNLSLDLPRWILTGNHPTLRA